MPQESVPDLSVAEQPEALGDKAGYIINANIYSIFIVSHGFKTISPFPANDFLRGQPVPDLEHYMESLASKSRAIEGYLGIAQKDFTESTQRDEFHTQSISECISNMWWCSWAMIEHDICMMFEYDIYI